MVRAIVHKEGDRYMLEVSEAEGIEAGLEDGQEIAFTFERLRHGMTEDEWNAMVTRIIDENREALEYLADH